MENTNEDVKAVVASLKTETTKTKKYNKSKTLTVEWPATPFSISDVQAKYPGIINITLRVKLNQAKDNDQLVEVGKNIRDQGRPTLLFCPTPVTAEKLLSIDLSKVELFDVYQKMVSPKDTTVQVATFSNTRDVVQPQVVQRDKVNQ